MLEPNLERCVEFSQVEELMKAIPDKGRRYVKKRAVRKHGTFRYLLKLFQYGRTRVVYGKLKDQSC